MGLIVFRCDASHAIGSGHVMRCRSLARALERRGEDVLFLCRPHPGDLITLLREEFRVLALPERPLSSPKAANQPWLSGRPLYAAWLGCTEEEDMLDTHAALSKTRLQPPTWLVIDHYGLGAPWQLGILKTLRLANGVEPSVLVLDDLADRPHQSSLLMDANRLEPATGDPYRDLLPKDTTRLLGPAFALLDPIYPQLQPLLPTRTRLNRVLVFFGGMDKDYHASVALAALRHPRLQHLSVDVVVGPSCPHTGDLEQRVRDRPNTRLHISLPCLAGLMARADLALGAAGSTSWERACLGLPSLLVPVAENQQQSAQALEAAGVARCLDLTAAKDPVKAMEAPLLKLLESPEGLQAMSEACLLLGDGRGLARVVFALAGPAKGLRLRKAKPADLWLYHWWANDPVVRGQSFKNEPIPLKQHQQWFTDRLSSRLALLRVLEDGDGLPIGQIRFDRETEDQPRAVVSLSLDNLARGRGLAPQLLELGIEELARCWGSGCQAYGEIRSDNLASCHTFLRAGFREGTPPRPGVRCFARWTNSAL